MTKNIVLEVNNKVLSANGGLIIYDQMLDDLNFDNALRKILPKKAKKKGISQFDKFKTLILGFIAGLDSISDIEDLRKDELFCELTAGACADSTMGDFLRSFKTRHLELLQEFLTDIAIKLRQVQFPDEKFVIYSIDATPNIQTGQKMEGAGWNYKNEWGLDTLNIYDQHGFHYGFDIRDGGTYSAKGSGFMLGNVYRKTPNHLEKFMSADSAYSNQEVYNTNLIASCRFVIAMKENVYSSLLQKNDLKWKKTNIVFFESRECETSERIYYTDNLVNGKKSLRVVFIRAPRIRTQEQIELFEDKYRYYAFVTDISAHEKLPVRETIVRVGTRGKTSYKKGDWKMMSATAENIINFYRYRGNTENFIKEEKGGLDLRHYPCQKQDANKAFGLIGVMAYNLMRLSSFMISKHGCYSKKIRRNFVNLPCQIVKHARKIILKFNHNVYQEVKNKIYESNFLFSRFNSSVMQIPL